MKKEEVFRRYSVFTIALSTCALGVSVITQSYLGTSPISSFPYVLSLNSPLSMGTYTFFLNIVLIFGQMLMLGKQGVKKQWVELVMQLPISLLFGLFIDIAMAALDNVIPQIYGVQIITLLIGCLLIALGISLEVVANVTMVSAEYFIQIASKRFNKEFGSIKIMFDITLITLATISSLILAGHIEGLREGTIITALITGPLVRFFKPRLKFIERWEVGNAAATEADLKTLASSHTVITISREYGSGGRYIGEQIAKNLGIKFYDSELIKLVAEESGFSEKFISEKEQHMTSGLLYQMILQDYEAPIEKSLSPDDALFVAQSRVIRRLASEGPCVIVGRCADYILHDMPKCIKVFLHASMQHKIERAVSEYGISRENAANEVERINDARENHYHYFTGSHWGDIKNYNLTCDTSCMDEKQVCEIIESLYKKSSTN